MLEGVPEPSHYEVRASFSRAPDKTRILFESKGFRGSLLFTDTQARDYLVASSYLLSCSRREWQFSWFGPTVRALCGSDTSEYSKREKGESPVPAGDCVSTAAFAWVVALGGNQEETISQEHKLVSNGAERSRHSLCWGVPSLRSCLSRSFPSPRPRVLLSSLDACVQSNDSCLAATIHPLHQPCFAPWQSVPAHTSFPSCSHVVFFAVESRAAGSRSRGDKGV